ncbi:hypothetical protein ABZX30_03025 [Streptomyces sp. NPDC004542]|uniref:hypothetical protein n=1 Tax=Streptomyces sp. NPDC004542 TaxID=3154281 RepID=UPI0033A2FA3B
MAGGGQQSSAQATRNGIHALESALSGITRSRQDVDSTRGDLSRGYQGSDGAQFGQLLVKWDEQATVIQRNLQDMIDKLTASLSEHQRTQTAAGDAIIQASNASDAAFQTLTGS